MIDYKTNLLGGGASAPTAWDYRPDAVATAMDTADYPLQALLYLVALHRYLRWRMAGYEPDRDIRGVGYLFVRGMLGPTTPTWGGGVCGVWSWRPPPGTGAGTERVSRRGAHVRPPDAPDPGRAADCLRAVRATGLLADFNAAGVLNAGEVHLATRLGALFDEHDESVLLACALAARAPRLGHVCVDLAAVARTASVDVDAPLPMGDLPWPDPRRMGGPGRRESAGRSRRC